MATKQPRRSRPAQVDDSQYESRLRMSWIDEGGIDLRAARANLLEFIAGIYEDALKLVQPQPREPAANRAAQGAQGSKAKASVRRKKVPARGKKKGAIRKKMVPIRRKKGAKRR